MAANPAATGARAALGLARKQLSPTSPGGKTPPSGQRSSSTRRCSASAHQVTDRSLYPPVAPERVHTTRTLRIPLGGRNIDSGVNYSLGALKWRATQVYKHSLQYLLARAEVSECLLSRVTGNSDVTRLGKVCRRSGSNRASCRSLRNLVALRLVKRPRPDLVLVQSASPRQQAAGDPSLTAPRVRTTPPWKSCRHRHRPRSTFGWRSLCS